MPENAKKPQIRFKGFTDAWEQRKLGEVALSFEYGLNVAAKEYDGVNKYLRITDIDDESHNFKNNELTSPDIDLTNAYNFRLHEGDILFSRTGASVGKTFIYKKSDGIVYFAGFLIRARIKSEYDAEFIFQNTLCSKYEKYIKITSQRSGQPGVNAQEYAEYSFLIPKYKEQKQIGKYFYYLDNLITLHQRKLDKLKNIKKSMLEKMFPKNGSNVPEIRFKGFTDAWEQRKLREIATYKNGKSNENYQVCSGKYELINLNSVSIDGGLKHSGKFVDIATETLRKNDLVMILSDVAHGDLLGRVALIPENNKFVLNQRVALLRLDDSRCAEFLFSYINSKQAYFKSLGAGSSQLNISKDTVENFDIKLPSLEEQISVSKFFEALDNLITLHQRKLEKLQNIKKACLEKMFV